MPSCSPACGVKRSSMNLNEQPNLNDPSYPFALWEWYGDYDGWHVRQFKTLDEMVEYAKVAAQPFIATQIIDLPKGQ